MPNTIILSPTDEAALDAAWSSAAKAPAKQPKPKPKPAGTAKPRPEGTRAKPTVDELRKRYEK